MTTETLSIAPDKELAQRQRALASVCTRLAGFLVTSIYADEVKLGAVEELIDAIQSIERASALLRSRPTAAGEAGQQAPA